MHKCSATAQINYAMQRLLETAFVTYCAPHCHQWLRTTSKPSASNEHSVSLQICDM